MNVVSIHSFTDAVDLSTLFEAGLELTDSDLAALTGASLLDDDELEELTGASLADDDDDDDLSTLTGAGLKYTDSELVALTGASLADDDDLDELTGASLEDIDDLTLTGTMLDDDLDDLTLTGASLDDVDSDLLTLTGTEAGSESLMIFSISICWLTRAQLSRQILGFATSLVWGRCVKNKTKERKYTKKPTKLTLALGMRIGVRW